MTRVLAHAVAMAATCMDALLKGVGNGALDLASACQATPTYLTLLGQLPPEECCAVIVAESFQGVVSSKNCSTNISAIRSVRTVVRTTSALFTENNVMSASSLTSHVQSKHGGGFLEGSFNMHCGNLAPKWQPCEASKSGNLVKSQVRLSMPITMTPYCF